jgi:selenocysteine lyase/cysteine desulfurase
MADYLERCNANHEGAFATSEESDAMLAEVHAATADYLGAADPGEVVFGQNMTTLTFAISRAIGRTLRPGDEIVVTRLDHDANVAPWLALEEERGVDGPMGRHPPGRLHARSGRPRASAGATDTPGCGRAGV